MTEFRYYIDLRETRCPDTLEVELVSCDLSYHRAKKEMPTSPSGEISMIC
jgi:hypothetical protein